MTIRHASIIPLIGGETIGSERAFGSRPDYFLSFEPFQGNDSHIVNHYENEVPYLLLDQGEGTGAHSVDVVSTVCPCAGLSMMHHSYGADNATNEWMYKTATYVLEELRPVCFWGENAPAFAGKIGRPVRENLYKIGRDNGYSMSVYRTKSLLHGVCQVRERSFYFFWKGKRVPLLNYYDRPNERIEDVILSASGNTQREPINPKTPSKDDPWYRYVLEGIHGGRSHREHVELSEPMRARGNDTFSYIEKSGISYPEVAEWMRAHGYEKEAASAIRKHEKLAAGGSIMRRGTIIPKDYIGAFVGHYPTCLTHPIEDRYVNYREAMTIMGLPQNFELLNPKKSFNHICQNVPVQTAQDMATEVREVLLGNRPWVDTTFMFQYNHQKRHEVPETSTSSLEAFME